MISQDVTTELDVLASRITDALLATCNGKLLHWYSDDFTSENGVLTYISHLEKLIFQFYTG